jgi:hypothetical protein
MKEKKNKTGLNTPEGYFEGFEERMMLKVMEDSLPGSSGFKVPEGYFEQFEVKPPIAEGTGADIPVISIFSKRTLLYVSGVAASLVLLISVLNNKEEQLTMDSLSVASVEAYINDGEADIDVYDVMAVLNEDELESLSIPSEIVTEQNLEEYLIENLDETSFLIE